MIRLTEWIAIAIVGGLAIRLVVIERRVRRSAKDATVNSRTYAVKRDAIVRLAHDIRAPIDTVYGAINLMLTDILGPITKDQHTYLSHASESCLQLLALADDLIPYVESTTPDIPYHVTSVRLMTMIEHAISTVQFESHERRIIVCVTPINRELCVYVDQAKFVQVMSNILSNAIRFSHRDSTINVTCTQQNATVLVAIRDHGCGIDERRSFGLGLSIIKIFMRGMGGEVMTTSREGEGTILTLRVPVVEAIMADMCEPKRVAVNGSAKYSVYRFLQAFTDISPNIF